MNEHKTKKNKKTKSTYYHHIPESSRRVSFSKPARVSTPPSFLPREECTKHGATNKHCSMCRAIVNPNSRPSKSSLKLGKQQSKTIGVSTRTGRHDSSTAVDSRLLSPHGPYKHGKFRRSKRDETSSTLVSQNDPTPIHLKYGTFRRLSKLRTPSRDSDMSPPNTRRDTRPVMVAISSVSKNRSLPSNPRQSAGWSTAGPTDRARPMRPSQPAVDETVLPPPKPATRDVCLIRTDTMHIDIKPKKFPSMLWC